MSEKYQTDLFYDFVKSSPGRIICKNDLGKAFTIELGYPHPYPVVKGVRWPTVELFEKILNCLPDEQFDQVMDAYQRFWTFRRFDNLDRRNRQYKILMYMREEK